MRKKKKKNMFAKITMYFILVLGLLILIYKTSYIILTDTFINSIEIDDTTSSYLSFMYVDDNSYSIELSDHKAISDFWGRRLNDNVFDFSVVIPSDIKKDVHYNIILSSNGKNVDDKYIKIYLTDQEDNSLDGFKKKALTLDSFDTLLDGKNIYSGVFKGGNQEEKYRLRIWVNDNFNGDVENVLSYNLKIIIDNK